MFSLVVTIVAIALVSALALATLYYGSSAFSRGSETAKATKVVNEGVQVHAAAALYAASTNRKATSIEELIEHSYLKDGVKMTGWTTFGGYAIAPEMPENQCREANKMLNIAGIPACDDPRYTNRPVCCDPSE